MSQQLPATERPVLSVTDLTVRFKGAPANVVDGVSFKVQPGKTLAELGAIFGEQVGGELIDRDHHHQFGRWRLLGEDGRCGKQRQCGDERTGEVHGACVSLGVVE